LPVSPLRQRYIAAGLITPDPYLSQPPMTADEMIAAGYWAAGEAKQRGSR
jgi:hypothetical protein